MYYNYVAIFVSFSLSGYYRGNPIADLDEVAKLKCLPLIRALILVGAYPAVAGGVTGLPYPP